MNFLSRNPDEPVAISVILGDNEMHAMIRTKEGTFKKREAREVVDVAWWRRLLGLPPGKNDIISALNENLPVGDMRQVTDAGLQDQLLSYHEKQNIKGFKFGVMYAAPEQTKEDEMFSNVEASPEFEEFLGYLGDKVVLDGWDKFRGGLDVMSGSTGTHSVFTEFNNNPIMYHVSTMLPFNEADKQQLERKRHIGNDQVVVLYQDGDTTYRPTTVSSRQIHVVVLVKSIMVDDERHYRVAVVRREEVRAFGPPIPEGGTFKAGDEFRTWILTKLLNAEQACYEADVIRTKLQRTRKMMLADLISNYA
eukprot:TRINITY_DN1184_c0_g1_i1.p2 TRINITY_DN1184_c0_g1~~TRINITY_DN1184_c0_g1_i1.p2  ORF type:complete len:307 (+),score=95.66 TRINITY_DN1184_c0_g1_i1:883-1803(+)